MLDALFSLKSQLHAPVFDEKYHADQAIVKASLVEVPNSKRLVVVFLPWHVAGWVERLIARKLRRAGANALMYQFNPAILESEAIAVKDSFEYIALSISVDIKQLKLLKGYKEIELLGISLGNVALCITAEKLHSFDNVYMLVPGSNLADAYWHGWRTHRLRKHLQRAGIQLEELEKEWQDLAPDAHVPTLLSHNIQLVIAKHDKFIPTILGERLVQALPAGESQIHVTRRPFGHMATILMELV